jgi:enamine deaminase RidA (YjgF/YER057c/UK114 family)
LNYRRIDQGGLVVQHDQLLSKLDQLNIKLDTAPKPTGNYAPFTLIPPILYLSGVTPKLNNQLQYVGKIGRELTKEDGYQAARLCIINHLGTMFAALGDLGRVAKIVKMAGFINADPEFTALPDVLNGASDVLVELFGEQGMHARSAIGVSTLPSGAAVEIELIVKVD